MTPTISAGDGLHLYMQHAIVGKAGELNIGPDLQRLRRHAPAHVAHKVFSQLGRELRDLLAAVEVVLELFEDCVGVLDHVLHAPAGQNSRQGDDRLITKLHHTGMWSARLAGMR